MPSNTVFYQAKILSIDGENITVLIEKSSACASCYNKGACAIADKKEVVYTIESSKSNTFAIGEIVRVGINTQIGLKAVVFVYIFPLLLFFAGFLITRMLSNNELMQAIIAIAIVAIYYFLLSKFKSALNKQFNLIIEKL